MIYFHIFNYHGRLISCGYTTCDDAAVSDFEVSPVRLCNGVFDEVQAIDTMADVTHDDTRCIRSPDRATWDAVNETLRKRRRVTERGLARTAVMEAGE